MPCAPRLQRDHTFRSDHPQLHCPPAQGPEPQLQESNHSLVHLPPAASTECHDEGYMNTLNAELLYIGCRDGRGMGHLFSHDRFL